MATLVTGTTLTFKMAGARGDGCDRGQACATILVPSAEPSAENAMVHTRPPTPPIARRITLPQARRKLPAIDRRVIEMRPPYDLHRKQVALTCGYHDSCVRYPSRRPRYKAGQALDWNDNNGTVPVTKAVFFTASVRSAVPGTRVATVGFRFHRAGRDEGFPCQTLVASVRSYPTGALLFNVMFEHTAPARGLRPIPLLSSARTDVPNVVARIGTMVDDPCPYFTPKHFHTHVEPLGHDRRVAYARNTSLLHRLRVIPDVNGCGREACDGPTYPGPRWSAPYYRLWTFRWTWRVRTRSGALVR